MKRFLKLTGGSFSGRRLYVPDIGVRPATNLVREAIFSSLFSFYNDGVKNLRILDLFAGTGSLGLEALSRGASSVTFVDQNIEAVRSIRKNMNILSFSGEVIKSDVNEFLKKGTSLLFDLIFMDPPYRYKRCKEVVAILVDSLDRSLSPILIYERSFKESLPDFGYKVQFLKRKKYGQSEVLYYRL